MPQMKSCGRSLIIAAAAALGLSISLAGCSSPQTENATSAPAAAQPQPPSAAPAPQNDQQRYDLKGKVVAVDKPTMRLTVDHEAIPGFMGAMSMPYTVKDERLLDNLAPGDPITAKVVSADGGYWLEDIKVVKDPAPAK